MNAYRDADADADALFFFCASDVVGENSETVTVAKGREVPVFGTVPGVFMRIPHS